MKYNLNKFIYMSFITSEWEGECWVASNRYIETGLQIARASEYLVRYSFITENEHVVSKTDVYQQISIQNKSTYEDLVTICIHINNE